MRFIRSWSYGCANLLSTRLNENHQKRGIYYFGFQALIGGIVKGVLLVAASLIAGAFIPTVVVIASFAALRLQAGGYHMDTYGKCIAVSIAMFLAGGTITQYTWRYWGFACITALVAVSFVLGMYVLIRWAPRDNPNRPITKPKEIKKFRILSFMYMGVWLVVQMILLYTKSYMYVLAVCFGLLLEIFIVSPFGYSLFDRLSGKMSRKKK